MIRAPTRRRLMDDPGANIPKVMDDPGANIPKVMDDPGANSESFGNGRCHVSPSHRH